MRMFPPFLLLIAFTASGLAQDSETRSCDFADGNQITMQYSPKVKQEPRNGRVWSPGIILYVQIPLLLGNSQIPLGAYTIYLIPEKKNWTLLVNKNVTVGSAYNSGQDIAHAQMDLGEIPDPTNELQLSFAHVGAKQCSLRVYYQKTGAFVDFTEK